jgi:putative lipoprotein
MHGLALLFTLHFGDAPSTTDGWRATDKAKHFLMSAFVQSASFSALRTIRVSRGGSLAGATVFTAGIGIGKELYDRKYGGDPSYRDLVADGAGMLAAAAILRHTER